ncbi:MAG: hypothetical protein ACLGIF_10245 [Actinomycetes bacterium]
MTASPGTPPPDPWPAIDQLASVVNELAGRLGDHTAQLEQLGGQDSAAGGDGRTAADHGDPEELRAWVQALVDEYGLHAEIGGPERWEAIPPLRAELVGLKIADVRSLELDQGSFEFVYWHDALARVLDRAAEHADRWQQDRRNQSLLGRSA